MRLAGDDPLDLRPRRRFAEALEGLREALAELEALDPAELDVATLELRDRTRAMLDRYDADVYDELVTPADRDEFDHGLGEVDGGGE